MTTSTTAAAVGYLGNGVTVAFPTTFRFLQNDQVVVSEEVLSTGAETVLSEGTHYTLSGRRTPAGGTVTMVTAPSALKRLWIRRVTARTQTLDLRSQAAYNPEVIEDAFDRTVQQVQEVEAGAAADVEALRADFDGELASLLESYGVGIGNFLQGGTGAVTRTAQSKMREIVSVLDFGAVGNGVTDDTAAINAAATYARSIGAGLRINPTTSFYLISSQLDLTGIKHIDGKNALIKKSANDAYAVWPLRAGAIKIGHQTPGQVLQNANIWLEVQNFTDGSTTDGVIGIQVEGLRYSEVHYMIRGFDEGMYFNGATATSVSWLDNRFYPLNLFNNGSHHHVHLSGSSYFNANQFIGGGYYLGTNAKKSARAPFKFTTSGATTQIGQNSVLDAEISLDGGSYHADNALLVYSENSNTAQFHSITFRNCRYESNGVFATDPFLVNFAVSTNLGSRTEVLIELQSLQARWLLYCGDSRNNIVDLRILSPWSAGNNQARQRIVNGKFAPYQTTNGIYVPNRTLFDGNLTSPVAKLTSGVAARTSRANGDGRLFAVTSTICVGKRYKKASAQALYLRLPVATTLTVICYDAAGAVLTGTAPVYAQMTTCRNATFGGAGVYQGNSKWVWIHPDVDSFFIGAGPWTGSAREIPDVVAGIDVEFGDDLIEIATDNSAPNRITDTATIQSFFRVGMALDGTATNGWRCTFALATTSADASASSDGTIDLASVAGITSGDSIGIELDTAVAGTEKQIHWTTVNGAPAGSTVTLTVALPAAVAAGRNVYVNRWVAR